MSLTGDGIIGGRLRRIWCVMCTALVWVVANMCLSSPLVVKEKGGESYTFALRVGQLMSHVISVES